MPNPALSLRLNDFTEKKLRRHCCQKVHQESLLQKRSQLCAAMANEAQQMRAANRDACKRLFLDKVTAAEPGFVRMCSCQIGELSRDDDSTGGYYNSNLIDCADEWGVRQAQNLWGGNASLSVTEAHEPAAAATKQRSAGLQNPTIEKARTGPYFPFSVFA